MKRMGLGLAFVCSFSSALHAQMGPPTTFPTAGGFTPIGVVANDFDGDGVAEAVVVEVLGAVDQIEFFENDGAGNLSTAGTVLAPVGAVNGTLGGFGGLADVDADGDQDVVFCYTGAGGPGGDGVAVYINTSPPGGPVSFVADIFYPATTVDPARVAVADFNADGRPDLAVGNISSGGAPDNRVSIFLHNPGIISPFYGVDSTVTFPGAPTVSARGVGAADFDADGDQDLVVSGLDPANVDPTGMCLFTNNGLGVFALAPGYPIDGNANAGFFIDIVVSNFNGGGPDVAATGFVNPFAASVRMDAFSSAGVVLTPFAGGGFGPGDANGNRRINIAVIDYDQDGNTDVVMNVPGSGTSLLRNFLSNGAGGFPTTGTDPAPLATSFMIDLWVADFNGDGSPDIVACDNGTVKQLAVYLNTAPPASPPVITTVCPMPGGTIGVPYTQTLTGTGGITPYTWSTIGPLPTGLTLNALTGVISGTPTTAGVFPFTIVMTDAASTTDTLACSITVVTAPPPPPPPGGGGGGKGNTRGGGGASGWLPCGIGALTGTGGALLLSLLAVLSIAAIRRA